MKKLYPVMLLLLVSLLLNSSSLLGQCGIVTISTNTNTTQLNCYNNSITLTAIDNLPQTGTRSYLWNNGSTDSSITITQGGTYIVTLVYSDGEIECVTSSSIIISEDFTLPDVTALAIPNQICPGEPVTLVAYGADKYEWYADNGSSSTSPSYIDFPQTTTGYYVTGTGANGCQADNSVTVQVATEPAIYSVDIIQKPQCAGDYLFLEIFTDDNSDNIYTYQWYVNTNPDNTNGTPIEGATSSIMSEPGRIGTYYYYCIVTSACSSVTSDYKQVSLGLPVVITAQPSTQAQFICLGKKATAISIEVENNQPITFQWYENTVQNNSGGTPIEGANASTYQPSTNTAGTKYYYCVVADLSCGPIASKASGPVIVNPLPTITSVSVSGSACQNAASPQVIFTASNATPFYRFVYNINGSADTDTTSISKSDSAFAYPSTNKAGNFVYKVVSVIDSYGCTAKGNSDDTAVVIINPLPSASIIAPASVCLNSTPPQIILAASNGTAPYTFSYNINGLNDSSVTTAPAGDSAFINPSTQTVGSVNYNLVSVKDANGCTQLQNETAIVSVNPLPTASIAGTGNVCRNTDAEISFAGANGVRPYMFSYTIDSIPGIFTAKSNSNDSAFVQAQTNTAGSFIYNLVAVSDSNGCAQSQTGSSIITVKPLPNASVTGSVIVCQSSAQPPVAFIGSNGTAPYTFTYDINGAADKKKTASVTNDSGFVYASTDMLGEFAYNLVFVSDSNGCAQPQSGTVIVTVSDRPYIAGSKTKSICDSTSVDYNVQISDTITNYTWIRPAVAGVNNAANSGITSYINDTLDNVVDLPVTVPYYFTLSKGPNCIVEDSLVVTVNPTPVINALSDLTYCNGQFDTDGIAFSSKSPNTSFAWVSDTSVGFGTAGTQDISGFIATNTGAKPLVASVTVKVTTEDRLKCQGDTALFKITVNPSAFTPAFTWLDLSNNNLCSGSNNINFNVVDPADSTTYLWAVAPSGNSNSIIKDSNDANTVISFNKPGTYTVNVVATNQLGGCGTSIAQTINVNENSGFNEHKVFLKQPGNLLVYPDNTMDAVKGYQWGYDTVIRNGPDYALGPPRNIEGQVYQFFVPDRNFLDRQNDLDTTNFKYWVLLQKDRCYTKVYYNGPYADGIIQAPPPEDKTVQLDVLPNPNNGIFKMVLKGNIYGKVDAKIYNAMGRLVFSKQLMKTTAEMHERIEKANLPAGMYYLKVNSSDAKKAVTRFIIQY